MRSLQRPLSRPELPEGERLPDPQGANMQQTAREGVPRRPRPEGMWGLRNRSHSLNSLQFDWLLKILQLGKILIIFLIRHKMDQRRLKRPLKSK